MLSNKRPWRDRRSVKRSVREKLRGRTLVAFIVCIIPQVLNWVMRLIPTGSGMVNVLVADIPIGISMPMLLLSLLATVFVTNPMSVQIAGYFVSLNRDPENLPSPLTVCDCFAPGYWRLVKGMLLRDVRVALPSLVVLGVGALVPDMFKIVEVYGYECVSAGDGFTAFALVAAALYIYRDIVYTMTPYVLAEAPELSAQEALAFGVRLTRGRVVELLVVSLSFFGWLLLASVTLLLGAVYAYPYIEGTMAAYYLAFVDQQPAGDGGEAYAA